jgi:hypothetical protein
MPANPQIPKIVKLTLQAEGEGSADDFSADVIDAAVVPAEPDEQTVTTLDGVTHSDVGPILWALELQCVQDWDSARPGLAWYLFEHSGSSASFVYNAYSASAAESATEPEMTGTCRLVPIPYGGEGNVWSTATVRLPITGTPALDVTP